MIKSKTTHSVNSRKIDDFFSTPSLLSSEPRSEFDALLHVVSVEFPPKNFLDLLRNRRIVDALWDMRRAQNLTAGVIDSGRIEALALLLAPIIPDKKQATAVAQAYLEGGKNCEKIGDKFVDKLLLSEHELIGRAFAARQASIGVLEKMRVNRERSLMQALEGVVPQVAAKEKFCTKPDTLPVVSPPQNTLKGSIDLKLRQASRASAVSDEEELELPGASEDDPPDEDELSEEELPELDAEEEEKHDSEFDLGSMNVMPKLKVRTLKREVSTSGKSRVFGRDR